MFVFTRLLHIQQFGKDSVSQVFQECFTSISGVFHKYFRSVSQVFQECFTSISGVFPGEAKNNR